MTNHAEIARTLTDKVFNHDQPTTDVTRDDDPTRTTWNGTLNDTGRSGQVMVSTLNGHVTIYITDTYMRGLGVRFAPQDITDELLDMVATDALGWVRSNRFSAELSARAT